MLSNKLCMHVLVTVVDRDEFQVSETVENIEVGGMQGVSCSCSNKNGSVVVSGKLVWCGKCQRLVELTSWPN